VTWSFLSQVFEDRDFRALKHLACDCFGATAFYLSNVIIAGLAGGDWSELLRADSPKAKLELQTLLHPEMLGRAFQVLAGKKCRTGATRLAGFKFPRGLPSVLGIDDSVQ
jgi:hypothetical protein